MSDERTERCCNMREPKRSKLPPGQRRWVRCRRPAEMLVDIHQASDHPPVGTGWFEIPMCNRCFDESRQP